MYVPQSTRNFSETDSEPGRPLLKANFVDFQIIANTEFLSNSNSFLIIFTIILIFSCVILTLPQWREMLHLAVPLANWAAAVIALEHDYHVAVVFRRNAVSAVPASVDVPCRKVAYRREFSLDYVIFANAHRTPADPVPDIRVCRTQCPAARQWKTLALWRHQNVNSWHSSSDCSKGLHPNRKLYTEVQFCKKC